jgi:hypothetical protein
MMIKQGKEKAGSFEEAIWTEDDYIHEAYNNLLKNPFSKENFYRDFSYLARGCYKWQIENIYRHFSKDQVLFLKSEEFYEEPEKYYNHVCDFLGISQFTPSDLTPKRVGNKKPIDSHTYKWLMDYFNYQNEGLQELLGPAFYWE